MGLAALGQIAKHPDDGSYWVVDGQPIHFCPPALTMERVLQHYPSAEAAKRVTGAQWWALVKVLEARARPAQGPEAFAEAVDERVAIQTEGRNAI